MPALRSPRGAGSQGDMVTLLRIRFLISRSRGEMNGCGLRAVRSSFLNPFTARNSPSSSVTAKPSSLATVRMRACSFGKRITAWRTPCAAIVLNSASSNCRARPFSRRSARMITAHSAASKSGSAVARASPAMRAAVPGHQRHLAVVVDLAEAAPRSRACARATARRSGARDRGRRSRRRTCAAPARPPA